MDDCINIGAKRPIPANDGANAIINLNEASLVPVYFQLGDICGVFNSIDLDSVVCEQCLGYLLRRCSKSDTFTTQSLFAANEKHADIRIHL